MVNSRQKGQYVSPFGKKVKLPIHEGEASITTRVVTADECALDNLRQVRDGRPWMCIKPGTYTVLHLGNELMMSDTPMEQRTNRRIMEEAMGEVLVAGLGIGMIVEPVLNNPAVKSLTVLENSRDVIRLVKPTLPVTDRLKVVYANVFRWVPKQKYDVIYFDIWSHVNGEEKTKDSHKLHQRYKPHLSRRRGAWMASWCEGDFL